jgi:hypothetical protein
LADWRVLARALRQLVEPGAEPLDPVDELASFLGRDRFGIKLGALHLGIPRDLGEPAGNLTVTHEAGGKTTNLTLEPLGEGVYDQQTRVRTYTFRTTGEGASLVYRPGDGLWATLPLRKPGEPGGLVLSWIRGRSRLFEFEHLSRGAWLHPEGKEPSAGKYYEDLRLLPGRDTDIPRVPDLMPVVKLGG